MEATPPTAASRGSVLVVDVGDNRLAELTALLSSAGWQVQPVSSPENGTAEIAEVKPDVLLVALGDSRAMEHTVQTACEQAIPMDKRDLSLDSAERRHIEHVLALFGNHRTRAARALGISRTTLYKKLDESVQKADASA